MRSVLIVIALVAAASASGCKESQKITQDGPTTPTSAATATGSGGTGVTTPSAAASATAAEEKGIHIVVAAQDSDALSLVRTERLRAKAEGRILVVYAGAGWCEPCKRFKNAVQTGALDDKLAKTTLLVFDADRDTDRLGSAGYTFKFIPYVALPGADGHPTDFAEARSKGSESWRDLIAKLETWQRATP